MNTPMPLTEASNKPSPRARDLPPAPPDSLRKTVNGTPSQQVIEALRNDETLAAKVRAAIEGALNATRSVWSKEAETFIEVPDYKTRIAAAELYLHNTVGLPVQRTENLNINKTVSRDKGVPPPAALAEMNRMIARAETEERKKAKASE